MNFPTAWSNWIWNNEYNQYYRYRQIAATSLNGEYLGHAQTLLLALLPRKRLCV